MELSVFRQRLSALGADISRWPDAEAAVALLSTSDEAIALLAAAVEGEAVADEPGPTDAILDAALGRKAD